MQSVFAVILVFGILGIFSAKATGETCEGGCSNACKIKSLEITSHNPEIMKINLPDGSLSITKDCEIESTKKDYVEIVEEGLSYVGVNISCNKGMMKLVKSHDGCEEFKQKKDEEDAQLLLALFGLQDFDCDHPSKGKVKGGKNVNVCKSKDKVQQSVANGESECENVIIRFADKDGKPKHARFSAKVVLENCGGKLFGKK